MKKGKAIIFIGAVLLFLTILACGSSDVRSVDSSDVELAPTKPPPTKTRTPIATTLEDTEVPATSTPKPTNNPASSPTSEPVPTEEPVQTSSVRIVPGSINVRSGPGPDNDVIAYLYHGDVVSVVDTNSDQTWFQVHLPDGRKGWIGSSLMELIDEAIDDQESEATVSSEAATAEEVFAGRSLFRGVGTEILTDPDDILSDILTVDIDDVVSNPLLYRYHYTESSLPEDLYDGICPDPYQTVWYSFEADDNGSISLGFTVEVKPESENYEGWFSPIFMDEFVEKAGNPTFTPPVYLAMCADPVNGHSHIIFLDSQTDDMNRQVRCSIIVFQGGHELEHEDSSEFSGVSTATCFFDAK